MSDIYSQRFLCQAGLSGTGSSFTVPPGYRAIIKQLSAYCSPGAFHVTVFLEDDETGAALWQHEFDTSPGLGQYFGSYVFDSDGGFHFQVDVSPIGSTASADVYAGGYLLTAP